MQKQNTETKQTAFTSGFSLVEVLVALSLFTVVVTISVSSLLVIINANAKAQNMQLVMTNLTFALDSMTREIRTGTSYYCSAHGSLPNNGSATNDCTGNNGLAINEGGDSLTDGMGSRRIAYRYNATNNAIERRLGTTASWVRVTSPEITIDELEFIVSGSDRFIATADTDTPTVTIFMKGTAGRVSGVTADFEIQTTIAQQVLDL